MSTPLSSAFESLNSEAVKHEYGDGISPTSRDEFKKKNLVGITE